jgi:hypothetical protein
MTRSAHTSERCERCQRENPSILTIGDPLLGVDAMLRQVINELHDKATALSTCARDLERRMLAIEVAVLDLQAQDDDFCAMMPDTDKEDSDAD